MIVGGDRPDQLTAATKGEEWPLRERLSILLTEHRAGGARQSGHGAIDLVERTNDYPRFHVRLIFCDFCGDQVTANIQLLRNRIKYDRGSRMRLDEKLHAVAVYVWPITLAVFFDVMRGTEHEWLLRETALG